MLVGMDFGEFVIEKDENWTEKITPERVWSAKKKELFHVPPVAGCAATDQSWDCMFH
jgi:hypothetical protein